MIAFECTIENTILMYSHYVMEVSDSAGKLFPATGVGFSLIGYSFH